MKRKIIYLVTRMIIGGAQETVKYTVEHFHQRGDEVLLVSGVEAGREGLFEVDAPMLSMPEIVRRISPKNDLKAFLKLVRLFQRERPDIVHAATAKARFLVLAARVAGVPIVMQTIHGFSFNNEIDKKRGLYIRLERLVARFCHCNVMVSKTDERQGFRLRILRRKTTALITPGVNVAKMRGADAAHVAALRSEWAPLGETVFTLVGRLSNPKTPEVFVEAAHLILQEQPNAKFLLVGDGSKRELLTERIRELKMTDKVLLLGLRTDVGAVMAASDIIAHCSTHEGLPKTVLEAMAAGKPVIASNVGGVPHVVHDGENGLLVPPQNPTAMADAMRKLMTDAALRARLVASATDLVHEYSLEKTLADTEKLYDRLLARRK